MAAFTLGEAAARAIGGAATSGVRVRARARRASLEAGSFEHGFFAAPARGEGDGLLRAARAALDEGRRLRRAARGGRDLTAPERAIAALTAGAVRVLEELATLARLCGGRVHPSFDHLARATALGRATVARGIAALEAAGFLQRRRRFRRTGEGRYAQTSNAYRLAMPAPRTAARAPNLRTTPAPVPDDVAQAEAERAAATRAMGDAAPARDLARLIANGPLGQALARLGARIDAASQGAARESHCEAETTLQLIYPLLTLRGSQRRDTPCWPTWRTVRG